MEELRRATRYLLTLMALVLALMSSVETAAVPVVEKASALSLLETAAMALLNTVSMGDTPPDVKIKLLNQNNGTETKSNNSSYSFYKWAIDPRNPDTNENNMSTTIVLEEDPTTEAPIKEAPTTNVVTTEATSTEASILYAQTTMAAPSENTTAEAQVTMIYNKSSTKNLTSESFLNEPSTENVSSESHIKDTVKNNSGRIIQLEDSLENIIKRLYRLEERIADDHQEDISCPSGYFLVDGQCFFLPKNNIKRGTWNKAQDHCKLHGGFLAEPISIPNFRRAILDMSISHDLWLGSTDRQREGVWRWSSDEAFVGNKKSWYPGEPNNNNGRQNCLVMMTVKKHALADRFCETLNHFICQKK